MFRNSFKPAFALLAAMAPMSAYAQSPDIPGVFGESIAAFQSMHPDGEIRTSDMNMSGSPELLLISSPGCENGCDFALLSADTGMPVEIYAGSAASVDFLPTQGQTSLLEIDSVTWAFDGATIYPFGDYLQGKAPRTASSAEAELVADEIYFQGADRSHLLSFSFPFQKDGAEQNAIIVLNDDPMERVGQWGTPYIIFSAEGMKIHEGVAQEHPRIFLHFGSDGFTLIDMHPAGMVFEKFM